MGIDAMEKRDWRMHPRPLFSLWREVAEEIRVFGEIVAVDHEKPVFEYSDRSRFPARSLLKPFQFLAAMGSDWERLTSDWPKEKAAACMGSISASREQVDWLLRWWSDKNLLSKLLVPKMYPMEEGHRAELRAKNRPAEPIFHTCFSKHLGILSGCAKRGWPLEGYLETGHPYWKRVTQLLQEIEPDIEAKNEPLASVTDGCLLPSPVLEMRHLASLYRRLAAGEGELSALRDRMMQFPQWVGGVGRLDTRWMEANPGKLVAKEGADGLWGVGIVPCDRWPRGLGIVLKLASGYHPPLAAMALAPVLSGWGVHAPVDIPRGHRFESYLSSAG
jgi:L-asparaginase II